MIRNMDRVYDQENVGPKKWLEDRDMVKDMVTLHLNLKRFFYSK